MAKIANSVSGLTGNYQPQKTGEVSSNSEKKRTAPPIAIPAPKTSKTTDKGALSKLQDLKKIFDGGLITADEYGAKKKQILEGM